MDESRAAVQEYERLEAALSALDTGLASPSSSQRSSPRQSTPRAGAGGARRRRRTRKRAPRGANREAVRRALQERPGATSGELSTVSGVEGNTLYGVLRALTGSGEAVKTELPGG